MYDNNVRGKDQDLIKTKENKNDLLEMILTIVRCNAVFEKLEFQTELLFSLSTLLDRNDVTLCNNGQMLYKKICFIYIHNITCMYCTTLGALVMYNSSNMNQM